MYTLTFTLNGRVKTMTDTSISGAYEMFLISFGEALNELQYVDIWYKGEHQQYLTGDIFRKQHRHIEDKVGDNVTETMMKGGA